jgi:hypothetical protein
MEYTVHKLSKMAGISERTLRYYDEINLLKPARISSCPKAVIEAEGLLKENRKVTINGSKSLFHINYPRVAARTYLEINRLWPS